MGGTPALTTTPQVPPVKRTQATVQRRSTVVADPKQQVVVKIVAFGNQDAKAKFFSTRADIAPHFHKPGRYYCGRCMDHVTI